MQRGQPPQVAALFSKLQRGAPMIQASSLDLDAHKGLIGDLSPSGSSPRQLCIALAENLEPLGIKPHGARANLILAGSIEIDSGDLLTVGEAELRITFACEPCAHGARMAEAPMRDFRRIQRFLAIVKQGGRIDEQSPVASRRSVYPAVPPDFPARCLWALRHIPSGCATSANEFLLSIGASSSYARVLPRWMRQAEMAGGATYRVLTAGMTAPSWAPDAYARLRAEGYNIRRDSTVVFPLVDTLWSS